MGKTWYSYKESYLRWLNISSSELYETTVPTEMTNRVHYLHISSFCSVDALLLSQPSDEGKEEV